jgi:predicted 3-demethylubiquinone-9 3-methyltransferase (glyoxalase superfamily)
LISPCLWFDGQAKEAAEFYCSVFPNSKITSESPVVVGFQLCEQKFMGLNGGPMYKANPSISFYVACETEAQVDAFWQPLAEGGTPLIALDKYPWSEKYGWIKDKFGTTWQITLDTGNDFGQKITPSMLFTDKNHGKGGEALDFYTGLFPNSSVYAKVLYQEGENNYATSGMIQFSNFKLNGQSFIIMDAGFPQPYSFNEGISLVIDCENQEEVDYFWDKLTEGGQESMCAWLKDKYGVSWQIVPKLLTQLLNHSDREKANRAMQAMLKMQKIDTEALQKAFDGDIV